VLCNEGYMDWMIHQGSITSDLFIEFLQERVLPYYTPYPGIRSIIIMDNASIHKDRRILEACNKAGILLKFLPPYSPDFNPIKATFKDLKAWIKLNYKRVKEFEVFSKFLEFTVQQVCRRDIRCHYQHSGYIIAEG
jgi:transposase